MEKVYVENKGQMILSYSRLKTRIQRMKMKAFRLYKIALKLKPFDLKPFGASYIHIQGKYNVTGRFATIRIL